MTGNIMTGVPDRVATAAEAEAVAMRDRVRARIARLLPGATVRVDGESIEISGRDLVRRWTQNDALRDWREEER